MIQVTTSTESREQKMVKCCIAGKPFRKCHMPFWEQIIIRNQTKIWKYLTLFFKIISPQPCPPCSLVLGSVSTSTTRQLLAGIFQMWSVISSERLLDTEAGGTEEGKEKEETQDLML